MVAPTVDPQTRNALVYVDLPTPAAGGALRAGMFARGEFELGRAAALTLPQSAVLLRDGFAYVFRIEGDKAVQTKVSVGRRAGERIEITGGLEPGTSRGGARGRVSSPTATRCGWWRTAPRAAPSVAGRQP